MRIRILVALACVAGLSACGGGGATDPTADSTTAVTQTSTPAEPATSEEETPTPALSQEEIDTEAAVERATAYVEHYWELVGGSWQDAQGTAELLAQTAPERMDALQLEIDNYLYDQYTASGTATVENIRPVGYQTTETGTYIDVAMCQDATGITILYAGGPVEGLEMVRREVTYRLRIMPNDAEREPLVQMITAGEGC